LIIEIGKGELRWRFGPELIRKSVPLEEIFSAKPVRANPTSSYFGTILSILG
jgi:hypothetical protein